VRGERTIKFSAYGVNIEVRFPAGMRTQVEALLPLRRETPTPDGEAARLRVERHGKRLHRVIANDRLAGEGDDVEFVLDVLDAVIRENVAFGARDRVFFHAGAVALGGGVLVFPGRSFAGKSTLVAAMVRAGATYFSDEYAVARPDGLVEPYLRPISERVAGRYVPLDVMPQSLGRVSDGTPRPVRAVVLTRFVRGARWEPETLSPGVGALRLLEHAVPARKAPARALRACSMMASSATVHQGDRGEADEVVEALMEMYGAETARMEI
jgi:hypothetical protein